MLLVSCSTSKQIEPSFVLPKLEAVRPARVKVIEEVDLVSTQVNLINMMAYADKLESYCSVLENYIRDIEAII